MKTKFSGSIAFLLLLHSCDSAFGFNDAGHMTVALLAYQQLDPTIQAKAVAILKAGYDKPDDLPRFRKDLTGSMPDDLSPAERNRYVFATAATWPDIIRDEEHPCHKKYHKGSWHFINLPFVAPGDPTAVPPDAKPAPAGGEPRDILTAIQLCVKDLKDGDVQAHTRAARLCFLLHMIGDLHQPLHCATQFSDERLKNGDRGGNMQLLRRVGSEEGSDTVVSIHSIFDGLLGRDNRVDRLAERALMLHREQHLRRTALKSFLKQKDPADWAKESYTDAVEVAYLKGTLKSFRGKTVTQFHEEQLDPKKVPLEPADYETNARPVAERRAALAGYRLADLLEAALE